MKYIPLFELPVLVMMIFIKVVMLRREGIRANVLGKSGKTDYVLIPVVLFFGYAALSAFLDYTRLHYSHCKIETIFIV